MNAHNLRHSVAAALTVLIGAACGSGDAVDDQLDAAVPRPDAAAPSPDAAAPQGCTAPTGGPTIHNATDIRADETWAANGSPHIVNGAIRVLDGKTLTIEPCAEVQLAKEVVMQAGFGNTPSKIRAVGTASRPIVIKQKVAGERFDGLEAWFPATLELAHVTIEGGGSNRFRHGASITAWGDGALPTKPILKVDHVTVKDSAGSGVLLERQATFMAGSDMLVVSGSGVANGGEGEAVRIDTAAAGDVPRGRFTGNALDSVTIVGSNLDNPIVLDDPGVRCARRPAEDHDGARNLQRTSRRTLPTIRSAIAFMFGARTAVLITRAPAPSATRSNAAPSFSSRSRTKITGASAAIVAFRNCCAVHACVRFLVAAAYTTRREASCAASPLLRLAPVLALACSTREAPAAASGTRRTTRNRAHGSWISEPWKETQRQLPSRFTQTVVRR